MCSAIISTNVLQEDQGCVNAKNESKNSMLKSQNTRLFVATDFVPSWRQFSQCRRRFYPIFCWGVPALAARFFDQASPAVSDFFPTGQVIFLSEVLQSSDRNQQLTAKFIQFSCLPNLQSWSSLLPHAAIATRQPSTRRRLPRWRGDFNFGKHKLFFLTYFNDIGK